MPQKSQKKDHSLGAHMLRRSRAYFTGREEEINLFRETLQTLKRTEEDVDIKRVFNVHGQGGIGKTTLLLEYEQICDEEKISYVYMMRSVKAGKALLTCWI